MADDSRSHLVFSGYVSHLIGVVHNTVNRQGQHISCGTLQLEVHAVATDCGNRSGIKLLLGPVTAIDAEALMVVLTALLDNTEGIFFIVAQLEAQNHSKAFYTCAILAGHVVLHIHGNGPVLVLNIQQPCIGLFRIIGAHNAVSLVCGIPSVCISGNCIDAGLEAAGNVVDILISNKAIGVGLPIQQQRIAVDVQFLAVAGIGSNRQDDGVTQLIVGLVGGNLTIGQFANVDKHLLAGIDQLEGNLHSLIQVSIHSEFNPDGSLSHTAGIAGGNNLGQINGADLIAIQIYNRVGSVNQRAEIDSIALDLCLFSSSKGVVVLPFCRQSGTVHNLNSVLAIVIGMIQAQTQSFTIGEIEVINHREILRLRSSILNHGGNIIGMDLCVQPTGVAGCMAVQVQKILILFQNIPRAFLVLLELAGSELTGNIVDVLGSLEAVGAVPVGIDLLTIDQHLGVEITGIASNGQCNGIAQFAVFLVSDDVTVGNIGHIDHHIFRAIYQLEGEFGGVAIVAIQSKADLDGSVFDTAGLTGSYNLGKVIGADFFTVNIDIGSRAENLNTVFDAAGLDFCSLLVGQRIASLPCRRYSTTIHSLNAVNTVTIGMVQTDTEIFTVRELEEISQRIIIGIRRHILGNGGDIIGINHRIQSGIYTLHALLIQHSSILTGNIPGFCVIQEGRCPYIHSRVICNTEGDLQQLTVGRPGFEAKLCRTGVILSVENLNFDQFIIQPDCGIIALAHDAHPNAVFAGVAGNLPCIQGMNGLPVGNRVLTGNFCILQDILALFLQHVNMPVLAVAKPDHHTGTLLREAVSSSQICQVRIILQICLEGKVIVRGVAEDLTGSLFLVDNTIVLLVQDPAGALSDLEVIVFQNQFGIEILIQENTATNRRITFLFCLQNIVAGLHILQFKVTLLINGDRFFALGADVGQDQAFEGILVDIVQHNLAAKSLGTFRDSRCLGRYLYTVVGAKDLQRNASVLIEGYILDLLLAVDHNGRQRIAIVRLDIDDCIHSGNHVGRTGNGVVLTLLQSHRHAAHNTLVVEAEEPQHIRKRCAILLGIEIPVSVQTGIRTVDIIRGNVGRININKSVLNGLDIQFQPLHVIPGNKQLHAIAVAFRSVHFAALGGSPEVGHNIFGGCHIGITVFTVAPLEEQITGRQQIDLKHIVFLHTFCIGRCKIHFDTAVHVGRTFQINVDGHAFGHVEHKIHTLLAVVTGHSDVDSIAAILIVQVQPVVALISILVQNTIDHDACIGFCLGFLLFRKGIAIFSRDFLNS